MDGIPITTQTLSALQQLIGRMGRLEALLQRAMWLDQYDLQPDILKEGINPLKQCCVCLRVGNLPTHPGQWVKHPSYGVNSIPYASHTYCPDCAKHALALASTPAEEATA